MSDFNPSQESHWQKLEEAVADTPHGAMLARLMRQQYDHNLNQAGADWCRSGFKWLRYMRVELYELMDHYNSYKHWKAHKPDVEQARIELVDVLIFALSHVIESGNPRSFIVRFGSCLAEFESFDYAFEAEEINQACERIAQVSLYGAVDVQTLALLTKELGLDATGLYLLYQAKMALNHLRTENGYKEGTYQKVWSGMEDNEFMQKAVLEDSKLRSRILEEDDIQAALRFTLQTMYDRVTEGVA